VLRRFIAHEKQNGQEKPILRRILRHARPSACSFKEWVFMPEVVNTVRPRTVSGTKFNVRMIRAIARGLVLGMLFQGVLQIPSVQEKGLRYAATL